MAAETPGRPTPNRTGKTRRISLGGMLTALILVFIFLAGVSPISNLAFYSFTSLCIAIAVIESGLKAGLTVFLTAAALSAVWPGLVLAWPFLFFFGPYPLAYAWADHRYRKGIAWLLRLLYVNLVCLPVAILILRPALTGLAERFGSFFWLGLFVMVQVVFLCYHLALTLLIELYRSRLHR